MSRIPNRFGGGARTNANGLHFEQTASLDAALTDAGYHVIRNEVYDDDIQLDFLFKSMIFTNTF